MKKRIATALFLIIIMMSSCGRPGDPVLDDFYTRNIYPGEADFYEVGSPDLPFADGYFNSIHIEADSLYVGGEKNPWEKVESEGSHIHKASDIFSDNPLGYFLRDDGIWAEVEGGAGHTHENKTILDQIEEAFTTPLKTSYDWLVTNITVAWKTTVDNFIASKGVASGLAPLDVGSKVPTVNLGGAGADGTKYLRGDQTWATPAGGGAATYTELDGSVSTTAAGQGGGDGAWVDWDLSGTLPTGTIEVDILIAKKVATDDVGCRKNGSGLARDIRALKLQCLILPVEVAADRIIEIMSDDVSDANTFSVIGYWE